MQLTDKEKDIRKHALRRLGLEQHKLVQLRNGSKIELTPTGEVLIRPESEKAIEIMGEVSNTAYTSRGYYLVL